jgi:hypothetical protein
MCETGTGKQVAQIHDSYMMIVVVMMMMIKYGGKNYSHQYLTKLLELSLKI